MGAIDEIKYKIGDYEKRIKEYSTIIRNTLENDPLADISVFVNHRKEYLHQLSALRWAQEIKNWV